MGWHTKGNVNLNDYYNKTAPERAKIPHSKEEFEQMSYIERLQLFRTNKKLYNIYTGRPGRLQSWEHR